MRHTVECLTLRGAADSAEFAARLNAMPPRQIASYIETAERMLARNPTAEDQANIQGKLAKLKDAQ